MWPHKAKGIHHNDPGFESTVRRQVGSCPVCVPFSSRGQQWPTEVYVLQPSSCGSEGPFGLQWDPVNSSQVSCYWVECSWSSLKHCSFCLLGKCSPLKARLWARRALRDGEGPLYILQLLIYYEDQSLVTFKICSWFSKILLIFGHRVPSSRETWNT